MSMYSLSEKTSDSTNLIVEATSEVYIDTQGPCLHTVISTHLSTYVYIYDASVTG